MACDHRPKHRIYMSFFLRFGWYVFFFEPDLNTPLPRTFNFADPEKIPGLAHRAGALEESKPRVSLDREGGNVTGGPYLSLTEDQYRKLG
jgi:hypothetical protein